MKKVLKILICLLFLSCMKVNASSFSMNLSGNTNVKVGEEVNVSISLNNISGIPNGLNVCQLTLSSSNVSINSILGNGWNVTNGNVLIMDSANSVTNSATIANIKATVNNAGSISISNIMCSDGENEYNANSKTITFSIKEEVQTTTQRVQIPQTTTQVRKSSLLKSIIIEGVDFEFNKNTLDYNIEVGNSINNISIKYETDDINAKVEKIGEENLIVGENKIQLIVTNGDSKSIYNLNILRKDKVTEVSNNETEILEALKQDIDTLKVKVDVNDKNKFITDNILKYLKENNKNILYEVYDGSKIIYSVKVLGKNINDTEEFSFNIRFNSNYENTLGEQLKNYRVINFDYRGMLPKDTEVTIYNTNFNDKVYLYDYNHYSGELEFVSEVENGNNIKLKLNKSSEYLLSDYNNTNIFSRIIILSIVLSLLVVLLIVILIYKSKKTNKNSNVIQM